MLELINAKKMMNETHLKHTYAPIIWQTNSLNITVNVYREENLEVTIKY